MANFDGQNTDGENNKALAKATPVEDDVKTKALGSAQTIARESTDGQNTQTGSGGENPGANVQAGK
jgi:hypothetical protein